MSSCYTMKSVPYSNYSFSLADKDGVVKDTGEILTHIDSSIIAVFSVEKEDISMTIKNQSPGTIKLIWDETLFLRNGSQSRVMHSGIKFIDRNHSMPPSIIPSETILSDVIIPTDNIYWKEGYYSRYGSSPGGWEKKELLPSYTSVGDKFGVYMPLNVNGITREYSFNFTVVDKRIEYRNEKKFNKEGTTILTIILCMLPFFALL